MNEKIDTIIKYLQNKSASFTVGEINEISGILNSMKVEVPKDEEVKKEEPKKK